MDNQDLLERCIAFHGHFCPGLTIGYRAALIGLRELGVERAADEDLVAICETDACGVDAVQFITGCSSQGQPHSAGLGQASVHLWPPQRWPHGPCGVALS
jgi:formylmethanofuran dehydrogenase subunit E